MVSATEKTLLRDFDEANRRDKILIAFQLLEELEVAAQNSNDLQSELETRHDDIGRCKENHKLVSELLVDLKR